MYVNYLWGGGKASFMPTCPLRRAKFITQFKKKRKTESITAAAFVALPHPGQCIMMWQQESTVGHSIWIDAVGQWVVLSVRWVAVYGWHGGQHRCQPLTASLTVLL